MEESIERCSQKQVPCPTYSLFFLIFPDPLLFSKRPSFHRRFLLPLLHCFCVLHPVSLYVALPLSSFFLFFMITVSFSLLRCLSPSLSLRSPPGVAYALLILSDFTRQTLYKRWVLLWTWSCAAHIAKKKIILLLTSKPSLRGWALQGHSGAGHSKHSGVGHSRETLRGHWGWALQVWVGRSRNTLRVGHPGEEKSSGRGEELRLRSNNPTPRVGNKRKEHKDKGS